jgi:hypothetical protein
MSQCHDPYESPPSRATTREPVDGTQCHDSYPEMEVATHGPDEKLRTDLCASRQPAYA